MQLESQNDEIQQSTSLRWLADFLHFVPEVMVPFTPRLIGAVLPNLAHHVPMIQSYAQRTNKLLSKVIDNLPSPDAESPSRPIPQDKTSTRATTSPTPGPRQSVGAAPLNRDMSAESLPEATPTTKSRSNTVTSDATLSLAALDITSSAPVPPAVLVADPLRSQSPTSQVSAPQGSLQQRQESEEPELFDYSATVNALTIQFLNEHEETRVAALRWLIMLHQKAPKQVCQFL
jgi:vacuole morphology and inheritance protein 14